MSVRSGLADALTEALPTFAVIDHSADTVPAKATAMVYVEKVDHGTTRPLRTYTLTVLVIVPQDDEGALEDALEDVLEAVDSWAYPATWTSASGRSRTMIRRVSRVNFSPTWAPITR